MRLWDCRFLPVLFSACVLSCSFHRSRHPRRKTTTARPLTPRNLRNAKRLRKELSDRTRLLMEEVPDIITEDDVGRSWSLAPRRNANNSLKSFGGIASRPRITHQPCREEHTVARLRDEHFASASAGARPTAVASTSSGVPDEIESHPLAAPRSSY